MRLHLLLPIILLALVIIPVRAQQQYYFGSPSSPYVITGPSAYIPGFQLHVQFDVGAPSGVTISVNRASSVTNDTAKWAPGFQDATFQTDSLNQYTISLTMIYDSDQNQTITISTTTGGEPGVSFPIKPVIAYSISMTFQVNTENKPTYPPPSDVAAQVAAQENQNYQNIQNQLSPSRNPKNNLDTLTDYVDTLRYAFVIMSIIVTLIVIHLARRRE